MQKAWCVLLLAGVLFMVTAEDWQFQPFNTEPGIYFLELGNAAVSTSEWKFIVFYNLSSYWHEWEHLQETHEHLGELCQVKPNVTNYIRHCTELLQPISYLLGQIGDRNQILRAPEGRVRRAPLDFVGNLMGDLFGVMDQRDARMYQEQIQALSEGTIGLQRLVQQQTHVLDLTNNIIRKENELIKKHHEVLRNDIKNLLVHEEFIDALFQLSSAVFLFKDMQNDLMDMLADVHHGRAASRLFPPSQLKPQLAALRHQIPSTTRIPTSENHWFQIYKLLTIKAGIVKNQIIFEIRLPLLQGGEFQIFNLHPVPTRHKDKYVFIEPEFRNVLVDTHRNWYYPISEEGLQSCKPWDKGTLVCTLDGPLLNIPAPQTQCEMKLLAHAEFSPKQCQIRLVSPFIYIQQLQGNQWIITVPRETVFDLQCKQSIQPITIEGNGVLTLTPGCSLRGRSVLIFSHASYLTTEYRSFVPKFNLSYEMKKQDVVLSTENVENDLAELERTITDLKREEPWLGINLHHVNHYAISALSLLIIMILSLVVCKHRTCCHRKNIQRRPDVRDQSRPPPSTAQKHTRENLV